MHIVSDIYSSYKMQASDLASEKLTYGNKDTHAQGLCDLFYLQSFSYPL